MTREGIAQDDSHPADEGCEYFYRCQECPFDRCIEDIRDEFYGCDREWGKKAKHRAREKKCRTRQHSRA